MPDWIVVILTAIFFPILLWLATGYGLVAFMGAQEVAKPGDPLWAKLLLLIQVVLWGGAALMFAIAPIISHGSSGFLGLLIGGIFWQLFFREKKDIPPTTEASTTPHTKAPPSSVPPARKFNRELAMQVAGRTPATNTGNALELPNPVGADALVLDSQESDWEIAAFALLKEHPDVAYLAARIDAHISDYREGRREFRHDLTVGQAFLSAYQQALHDTMPR